MSAQHLPGFHYPYTKLATAQPAQEFKIAPNIYAFTGPSTVTLIIGDSGYVLVDVTDGSKRAKMIAARIKELTDKPLVGIILTHSHPDHISGGSVFLEGQPEGTPIWARSNFGAEAAGFIGLEKISMQRGARQFGAFIPNEMRKPSPMLQPKEPDDAPLKPIMPNQKFAEEMKKLNLGGVEMELYAVPGESADHLMAWLPKERVMACGDNIYGSFPNMYPIRGASYRDVLLWAKSIEKILPFKPVALITGHNHPELGEQECQKRIKNHYDAIMYVYTETVKGMDAGLSPEALATSIALPKELAELPYLSEFYGCIPFTVRAIYSGLLGWFDGNPSNLVIFTPQEEAEHMAALAGGAEQLLVNAEKALQGKDHRWVTKLTDAYLSLGAGAQNAAGLKKARLLKADALLALAQIVLPITGSNYLTSCALELRKTAE